MIRAERDVSRRRERRLNADEMIYADEMMSLDDERIVFTRRQRAHVERYRRCRLRCHDDNIVYEDDARYERVPP